jgi:predicted ATPase
LKIKKLHIKNFKSIADLEIIEPNPFTVFVGPNGSGKSNIFEALEFLSLSLRLGRYHLSGLFGGEESFINFKLLHENLDISLHSQTSFLRIYSLFKLAERDYLTDDDGDYDADLQIFSDFSRIFINKISLQKLNYKDNTKLTLSTDNFERVLKRLLEDENLNEEITEWLELFIPGFEKVEVISSALSGTDTLLIYEKGIEKPFTKELISDGTYNILVLITAILQSDEPQFLCIEEPENGLNPKVVKELVHFCRNACEEKGHYIWLNTHSQTLLSELKEEELIVVDKKKGETQIKQFKKGDFYGLRADEALLTNVLGGGIPW